MSTVIGINFGGSASSVAVISKEGLPDCIANDDGERQISNALSFSGEEEYVGIPAKSQLVRNNKNTVIGFRNLVGRSYDEVKSTSSLFDSASIVSVDNGKSAGFAVSINEKDTVLSAQEATTKYLSTLIGGASDFLGRKIDGAVVAVPSYFSKSQLDALEKACQDAAGVKVLQFLHEPAAVATAYGLTLPSVSAEATSTATTTSQDRNVVVLDVGASTTSVTVLSARSGLYTPLSEPIVDKELGGESFDTSLISFFSKEFTKKTKQTISPSNHRANMKLRLACETVKRTLSASSTANCSIESLDEGLDYHGSINRSRFDLLSSAVYGKIEKRVREAVEKAGLDVLQIQEVILAGGTCKNPTLASRIGAVFPEETIVSSQIDSDQVIAKGCVLQAALLSKLSSSESAYVLPSDKGTFSSSQAATSAPIGLLVPSPLTNGAGAKNPGVTKDGKMFITLIEANTPLPVRRIVEVPTSGESALLSLWEGSESIHVEAPPAKPAGKQAANDDDSEDEEDEEEEETRTKIITPTSQLAELNVPVKKGEKVTLTVVITKEKKVEIVAKGSEEVKLEL